MYLVNDGSKWTLWIIRYFFHSVFLSTSIGLIRIEDKIYAFRKIVLVNSHAFQIMCPINHDTNLGIVSTSDRKILHTRANINHTIKLIAAILFVVNRDSLRVN